MQVELAKRHEAKVTIVCMALLALAAGYLLLTRPSHRIEGDFLQREHARAVDEWLLSQLNATVAEQRARACLALGRIRDPATLPLLLNALTDHAASVRSAAAFAVGLMQDAEIVKRSGRQPRRDAADALLPLLQDEERAVAASAVEALGKLGFPDVAERLTQTAAPYPITLAALVRLRSVDLIGWIAERLKSDDQDNRWAAVLALNALDAPVDGGIARSFLNLTKDRETLVRIEAVAGLGRARPSQQVPAQEIFDTLVRMAADPDPKVRIAALGSLGMLGHPGTLEVLVESLRDRNENVASASIRAMTQLGDRRAVKVLDTLDPALRRAALESSAGLTVHDHAGNARAKPGYESRDYQRIARTIGHRVRMETAAGPMEIALDYRNAALTAEYFIELVEQGALDGARVVNLTPNRYLEVALPRTVAPDDAAARSGEDPAARPIRPEINAQPFLRGSLGMTATALDTETSRFFICLTPQPLANGRHTNFGRLVLGDNLLDAITVETRILNATVVE